MTHPTPAAWLRGLLPAVVLLTVTGPVFAGSDTASIWSWERSWLSVPRLAATVGLAACCWYLCFHLLFPAMLSPRRPAPPWPNVAFHRCLALFVLLLSFTLVLFFGLVSDELYSTNSRVFPATWTWPNQHWKWVLVLLIGAALSLIIWATGRQGGSRTAA
jgi:hypothetical protein